MKNMYDSDDEIEIDLREVFFALWHKLWMIVAALVVGAGLTVGYSLLILTPQYTSTTTMYILSKETTLTSLADLQMGSQLTKDYRVLVTTRSVLQQVIDKLGLDMEYEQLKGKLKLENQADTRILSISIEDPDPARAKAIVDCVATTSSKYIGDIMEMTPPKIIDEGIVANKKSSPSVMKNGVLGGMAAAVLVCFLIVLQVILNDTIRTEEDVERYLQLSVLASVPEREEDRALKNKKRKKKIGKQNGRKL